jgi:hypothetical protein
MKMGDLEFQSLVHTTDNFELRRAVERLREGLFDSLGVRLLTTGQAKLTAAFDKGVKAIDAKTPSHLCVCGAYGQGKSHSLNYIKQQALAQDFVVSYVNLDPRQVPFHDFKGVYRALMKAMEFPHGQQPSFANVWKTRVAEWMALPENQGKTCSDLVPKEIPHRFRAVLTAMAQKNIVIPPKKRALKKHAEFKPREFSWILKNALLGKNIPVGRLGSVLRYRQVPFYKDHSLVCRGQEPYLAMVQGMANLFRKIGFKGWLILFDEGESIVQSRITSRSKSYEILHEIFHPKTNPRGFYPVFAFTPDFFAHLEDETYDRVKIRKNTKNGTYPPIPYFQQNYSRAWEHIHIHTLQDLALEEWNILVHKLIQLHANAYSWTPSADVLKKEMIRQLVKLTGVEARLKLKFLVNHLDIAQQHQMMACAVD